MRSFFTMILDWIKRTINKIFKKDVPEIDSPEIGRPDDPGDIVCYYGCPNSNRAKKLQLGRELYK